MRVFTRNNLTKTTQRQLFTQKYNFSSSSSGKTCLVFPGQGAQYVGMGKDIYDEFSYIKDFFKECDESLSYSLSSLMFNGPIKELTSTKCAQPAVLLHSLALIKVLENEGNVNVPSFDVAMGLSLGEYTALTVSKCFDNINDALYTVDKRARFMEECCVIDAENENLQQKMLAILHDGSVSINDVESVINDVVTENDHVADIANYNSPKQIVISGHKIALDAVMNQLKKQKIRSKYINTGGAFHSSLMSEAKKNLSNEFKNININLPENNISVISNVESTVVNNNNYKNGDIIKNLLSQQVCDTVNWYPSVMKAIQEFGVTQFIEIGPKSTLSSMIKTICEINNIQNISTSNFDKLEDGLRAN